jgi:multiple antibiotic resistance protein
MAGFAAYLKIFIAIYVLVNPLEGLPVFLAGTQGLDRAARMAVARTAAFSVTCIMLVSLAIGRGLLEMLSISIADFSTAGGIIVFLIGLQMVMGPSDSSHGYSAMSKEELRGFGIVPLATPLLAGPGVISSVIVYASRGPTGAGCTPADYAILSAIIVAVGIATLIAFGAADLLRRVLGKTGIEVSTRISGILVAAIAIGMIEQGVRQMFPILTH